jgi:hypothetical protein
VGKRSVLPLIGLACLFPAYAGQPRPILEAAWREASRRAGVDEAQASPPQVDFEAAGSSFAECGPQSAGHDHLAARYLPDLDRVEIVSACARPIHSVLVHEFLHAIRERERRLQAGDAAGFDPEAEAWVQERAARKSSRISGGAVSDTRPPSAARSSAGPSVPSTSLP